MTLSTKDALLKKNKKTVFSFNKAFFSDRKFKCLHYNEALSYESHLVRYADFV